MRAFLAALAAATALLAAGCASSASSPPAGARPSEPTVASQQDPANPVPILRATGAHVPASEHLGDHDIFGDRMAEGSFHSGWEQVTVYTAVSEQALRAMLARQTFTPDDGTAVIVIPARRAVVLALAWEGNNGPQWASSGTPQKIAARVGGQPLG